MPPRHDRATTIHISGAATRPDSARTIHADMDELFESALGTSSPSAAQRARASSRADSTIRRAIDELTEQ
jgi:hypothetical protein